MPTYEPIAVLVAHEDPLVAAGIRAVLERHGDMSVRTQQNDRWQESAGEVAVVIVDYRSAMAHLQHAQSRGPHLDRPTRLLVVSTLDREWQVRSAMNAGVYGYILQSCSLDELVAGVRMLHRGSRYLSGAVARRIADSLTREALTTREFQVLELLTHGMCNKSIAKHLDIAVGTVKAHVKGVFEKLDARTRTHAVIVAAQRGLVREPASASLREMAESAVRATTPGEPERRAA